jgi:Ca2+-binding RTX toxin-like protein
MTTINLYDEAGVGFNMPSSAALGFSFSSVGIVVGSPSSDNGFTAIAPISGINFANEVEIHYTSSGDTRIVNDVLFNGPLGPLTVEDWNVVVSSSDFNSGAYFAIPLSTLDDTISGNIFPDVIYGGPGDDVVFGYGSADFLSGDAGDDDLWGDNGDDTLVGGPGRDNLTGGGGRDISFGNQGDDWFYFDTPGESQKGANRDQIVGFSHAQDDRINLKEMDASTQAGGNQKFVFIGSESFAHYHAAHPNVFGMVRFSGGIVQGNVNGNFSPDFEIKVAGAGTLVAEDFIL